MQVVIPALMTVCLLVLPAQAQYSGGSGTAEDPYQIATAEDLMHLGETPDDYDQHFVLTADIDLAPNLPGNRVFDRAVIAPDVDWETPSHFDGTGFTGVFDGDGHVISHLTIAGVSYLGLFGVLHPGATISNVGLESVDIQGTDIYVGGLVGYNSGGGITQSYSAGTVGADACVGGLAGRNKGDISTSYSSATVRGERYVGGLVGYSDSEGNIAMSYSTGRVSGNSGVGGLVGSGAPECTNDSFWDTDASGQIVSAGARGCPLARCK